MNAASNKFDDQVEDKLDKNSHSDTPVWMQARERGSDFWLGVMTRLSLLVGRRCSRAILYGIALYFSVFGGAAKMASRDYLSRCLGRAPRWRDFFRHVFTFSSTIHDRVFFLNDRFDHFDVRAFGIDALHADYAEGKGVLLLGAHLGSFEVLRALGRKSDRFDMAMAMYAENAHRINRALTAINPQAAPDIIALGTLDAMLAINTRLDAGAYVGMLADRASGPSEYRTLPFLGAPAPFPIGAFRLATVMKRPVYFMTGVYCGGNRYQIHFEKLADFSASARNRDALIDALMQKYVAALERACRSYPFNWFNFYDFWKKI